MFDESLISFARDKEENEKFGKLGRSGLFSRI
jgi:hypothetical protein